MRTKQMAVMNNDVYLLREAVVTITQMLAGQGLEVTQRGVTASVKTDRDGKPVSINLPYIPDNATPELCAAIQGFLDQEVASILFTDFKAMKKVEGNKALHGMARLIESARLDKAMSAKFRGSASNLATTSKFFLDKYTTPKLTEATIGKNDAEAIALLMHPLLRSMAGMHVERHYMSDKMGIVEEVYNKIKKLQPRFESCSSTEEAINLAREVRKALDQDDDEDGDGGGSGAPKAMPMPGGGKGGKGGKGSDEGDGSDEDGEEGDGDGGEGPSNVAEDGTWEGSEDQEIKSQDAAMILAAIDKEQANSFDKGMANLITGDTVETAKHADYLVFTKDNDVIENLVVGKDYRASMFVDDIQKPVEHMVGPLQKDLERAISARSLSVWENGRRSGRLHSGNLMRLAVGDDRVFRKKHESTSKDVAVSLVIDCSGSMSGGKIHLAAQAAYALSAVLERLRISHEVIGFTTGSSAGDYGEARAEAAKIGRSFTRDEALYMPVVKGYSERLSTETQKRFGWLPNSRILRNNIDGECVEIAARRLMARKESGKVMIVLSDGYPAGSGDAGKLNIHLQEVVKKTMKNGVDVIGIGIMSDSVRKFYPKAVVINEVDELPTTVIKELRHLLIK